MASSSLVLDECAICQRKLPSNEIEKHVMLCFEKQSQIIQKSPASALSKKRELKSAHEKSYDIFNRSKRVKIEEKKPEVINLTDECGESSKPTPEKSKIDIPLAELLRPENFATYCGQESAIGPNSIIRKLIDTNKITSTIFYGPPGCGKTTLAHIIYTQCNQHKEVFRFVKMSAVTSGIADVKETIQKAKSYRDTFKKQTILFMDEIHRFNKLQQDTFLPHIENGTIILLGATTENPSFSLNNALLSRCRVVVLEKLKSTDIMCILRRALTKFETVEIPKQLIETPDDFAKSLDFIPKMSITEECLEWISDSSDGDARIAINSLEMCLKQASDERKEGIKTITLDDVKDSIKRTHFLYDRAGDQHYDCISALHKSIRASDDNASLYWCMRMLEAGEDPRFICRRLIRAASEDIGLADSNALILAVSTMHSVEKIGMPESDCIIAQLVIYLARAPKSTESYFAMLKCREQLKNHQGPLPAVPLHLRNAPTKLMKEWGFGKNYNRLHKDESNLNYLPEEIGDVNFFEDE